jgi:hypothetical protein
MVALLTFSSQAASAPSRKETGENHRLPNLDSMEEVSGSQQKFAEVPRLLCSRVLNRGEPHFTKKARTLSVPTKAYTSNSM